MTTAASVNPVTATHRWLRPGVPRRTAAVLLLLTAAAHLPSWMLLYELLGVGRGSVLGITGFAATALVPVIALVTAAAFALTGSAASRLLGAVTVLVSTASVVAPLRLLGSFDSPLLSTSTLYALPFAVAAALTVSTVVALAGSVRDGRG